MDRVIKITLAYDGAAYVGWQRQASGVSIQGLLEDCLARIDGAAVTVHGAGRTDAGVHASGQVASARLSTAMGAPVIRRALNAMLPADVRALAVEDAPPGFHARYSAIGKTYEYRIWQGEVQPPFVRAWSWHIRRRLDAEAMDAAALVLEGRHDFSAFQSSRSSVKTAVRTVASARVHAATSHRLATRVPPGTDAPQADSEATSRDSATMTSDGEPSVGNAGDGLILVRMEADGFLRHMVRAVVGTLVEVGGGRRDPGSMALLLASRDRAASGATAPAHGLCLIRVAYPAPSGSL